MGIEQVRGCGLRKMGKLYMVCDGVSVSCDRLPLELEPCLCCGYTPEQNRSVSWLHVAYVGEHGPGCRDDFPCPICHPEQIPKDRLKDEKYLGLMWVGKRHYSPHDFIKEANTMGVSKAVSAIPDGLVLGKTWILLAHPEVEFTQYANGDSKGLALAEPRKAPGVFFAFTPQRYEMLLPLRDFTAEERAEAEEKLAKKGITLIWVPQGDEKDHTGKKQNWKSVVAKLVAQVDRAESEDEDDE